jgi:hypothetical protein
MLGRSFVRTIKKINKIFLRSAKPSRRSLSTFADIIEAIAAETLGTRQQKDLSPRHGYTRLDERVDIGWESPH